MDTGTEDHSELLAAFRQRVLDKIRRDLAAEVQAADALRASVMPKLRGSVEETRTAGHCERVWLFGSFAWGRPTERSDIDLLVEGDDAAVARAVDRACQRDVHAHNLATAPASLVERCHAEGIEL